MCACESLCVGVAHDGDDDDDDPIAYLCSVDAAAAADCELRCAALCWLPDFRVFVFAFESALRQ